MSKLKTFCTIKTPVAKKLRWQGIVDKIENNQARQISRFKAFYIYTVIYKLNS